MRANKVHIIIGRRGCGKTTFTLNLIASMRQLHSKIIIIDNSLHDSYSQFKIIEAAHLPAFQKGVVRVMVNEFNFEPVLEIIKTYVRNALVIFEDAGKYIVGTVGEQFRNVLLDTKQKNVDVCIQYHGVGDVPPKLFRYADVITLFKINDTLEAYRSKIPSFDSFKHIYNKVQNHPTKYHNLTFELN